MADIESLGFKINIGTGNTKSIRSAIKVLEDLKTTVGNIKPHDSDGLARMTTTLTKLGKAMESINGSSMAKVRKQITALTDKVTDLNVDMGNMKKTFVDVKKVTDQFSSKPIKMPKVVDSNGEVVGKGKKLPNKNLKSFTGLEIPEETYKKISGVLGSMGGNSPLASMVGVLGGPKAMVAMQALTIIGNGIAKIGEIAGKVAKSTAKLVVQGLMLPFRGVASAISNIVESVSGFVKRFGRLTVLKMIRGVLSQISKGIKEGTENLYFYSQVMGTDFAKSMDMAATSALYFKNSIGAMVAPLVNQFAPVLDMAIDKIVDFINIINQMFARLTGAATWTKALKYSKEYAENTQNASKAAKDFTASFDELNVINDKTSSAASSALDYSKMFEEVETDKTFATWIDDLQESIRNGKWEDVGRTLADALNSAIMGIDVNKIGTDVATKLNNAFSIAKGFLTQADTFGWGSQLGELLGSFTETFDSYTAGQTLGLAITRTFDFMRGFVERYPWGELGEKIADYVKGWFDGLDAESIGKTINKSVKGILEMFRTYLGDTEVWHKIFTKVADVIEGLDIGDILANAINVVAEIIKAINTPENVKLIKSTVIKIIKALTSPEVQKALADVAAELTKGAIRFALTPSVISDGLKIATSESAATTTGSFSGSSMFAMSMGKSLGENIMRGVSTAISSDTTVNHAFGTFMTYFSAGGFVYNALGAMGKGIGKNTAKNISDEINKLPDKISFDGLDTKFSTVKTSFDSAIKGLGDDVPNLMEKINTSFDSGVTKFGSTFDKMKTSAKGTFNGVIGYAEGTANKVTTAFNKILENVENLGNVTINGAKPGKISLSKLSDISIPLLANGGMLNAGSLFVAGERGAEAIGQFGNRTGVMNTDQMAVAVANGVYEAMTSAMNSGNGQQSITINLDGRTIWSNQAEVTRNRGYNFGMGAFNV